MFGFRRPPRIEGFEHKEMSVDEIRASGGLLVDIRTPPEWHQTGVIEGARLLTFQDPQSFVAAIRDDIADGRDVVLVCRSTGATWCLSAGPVREPRPRACISPRCSTTR